MHQLHHLIIQPEHFHNCMMAQHSDSHISFQKTFCTAIKILNNIFVLPCYSLFPKRRTYNGWLEKGGSVISGNIIRAPPTGWWMRKGKMNIYIYIYKQCPESCCVSLINIHYFVSKITKDICGTCTVSQQLERKRERERERVSNCQERERESTQICFF